ncbi:MAG: hypothetical protein HC900_03360, partial [Methylacidiphilales bacterium]|nr:hypothetical protein [Candidatus Methylacidiphilales bacterium]
MSPCKVMFLLQPFGRHQAQFRCKPAILFRYLNGIRLQSAWGSTRLELAVDNKIYSTPLMGSLLSPTGDLALGSGFSGWIDDLTVKGSPEFVPAQTLALNGIPGICTIQFDGNGVATVDTMSTGALFPLGSSTSRAMALRIDSGNNSNVSNQIMRPILKAKRKGKTVFTPNEVNAMLKRVQQETKKLFKKTTIKKKNKNDSKKKKKGGDKEKKSKKKTNPKKNTNKKRILQDRKKKEKQKQKRESKQQNKAT